MKKGFALVVSLIFTQNVAVAGLAESNFWAARRTAAQSKDERDDQNQTSDSALAFLLPRGSPLTVPFLNTGFPEVQVPSNLDHSPSVRVDSVLSQEMQSAVYPYATIHEIILQNKPSAKTVLLLQDAHLLTEAQTNISGAVTALAEAVKSENKTLLVGMEGARSGQIDFSITNNYPHRSDLQRATVGMLRANILNGVEQAAMGYRDEERNEGPAVLPFEAVGVEDQTLYDANVRALLNSAPIKLKVKKNIDDLRRSLTSLKKSHYGGGLISFDAKQTAYQMGTLGVPEYVMYLDSEVTATAPNLRELIEAALLEGVIRFDKVEKERTQVLSALVEKLKKDEVEGLVRLGSLFRSGDVSYAAFYDHLKNLAAKNGVPFTNYPELNLYVQYILKCDSVDHSRVFDEIRQLEKKIKTKLAKTDKQKNLLALNEEFHLLNKLVDHVLTENEWSYYELKKPEIEKWASRFFALGLSVPPAHAKLLSRLPVFEDFYRLAVRRNDAMTENLRFQFAARSSNYAVLVAGGFHSSGLTRNLKAQGFNVVVLSPKIAKMEEGLSSVGVLASGRLPLDRLFAGEKLFLPTPAVSAAGPTAANVAVGAAEAGRRLAATGRSVTVRQGDVEVTAIPGEPETGFVIDGENGAFSVQAAYFGRAFSWGEVMSKLTDITHIRMIVNGLQKILVQPSDFTLRETPDGAVGMNPLLLRDRDNRSNERQGRVKWARDMKKRLPIGARFNNSHLTTLIKFGISTSNYPAMAALAALIEALFEIRPKAVDSLFRIVLGAQPGSGSNDIREELEQSVKMVRESLGLENETIRIVVTKGPAGLLDQLAEIRHVYLEKNIGVIEISEGFYRAYLAEPELVRNVKRDGGFPTEEEARMWIIRRFITHELVEGYLRRVLKEKKDGAEDKAIQTAVHELLVGNYFGTGFVRPTEVPNRDLKAFYASPMAAHVLRIISNSRVAGGNLFKPGAADIIQARLSGETSVVDSQRAPVAFLGKAFSWMNAALKSMRSNPTVVRLRKFINELGIVLEEDGKLDFPYFDSTRLSNLTSKSKADRDRWLAKFGSRHPSLQSHLSSLLRMIDIYGIRPQILNPMSALVAELVALYPRAMRRLFRDTLNVRKEHSIRLRNELGEALKEVQEDLELRDHQIDIHLVKGDHLEDLGEIHYVGKSVKGKSKRHYVIEVSEEFIRKRIINPYKVTKVKKQARFINVQEAKSWLLRRFIAHELIEEILRIHDSNPQIDAQIQQQVHGHLVKNWMGPGLPSRHRDVPYNNLSKFYHRPMAQWAGHIIITNKDLFKHNALDLVLKATPLVRAEAAPVEGPSVELPGAALNAFFGNNPLALLIRSVFEKFEKGETPAGELKVEHPGLKSPKPGTPMFLVARLIEGFESVLSRMRTGAAQSRNQQNSIMVQTIRALEKVALAADGSSSETLLEQVVETSLPAFKAVKPLTDLIVELSGLRKDDLSDWKLTRAWLKDNLERAYLAKYFTFENSDLELTIYLADEQLAGEEVAFFQKIPGQNGGRPRFIIRVSRQSLDRIFQSAASIQNRAAETGVLIDDEEARVLAFQRLLLHEIGEGILGLSDENLVNLGIADEGRVGQLAPSLERTFFRTEGLLGQLQGATGNRKDREVEIKTIKDPLTEDLVWPDTIREQELKSVAALGKARPILRDLFSHRKPQNYRLGFTAHGKDIVFYPDARINLHGLDALRHSERDRSRASMLENVNGGASAFRPAREVYESLKTGKPETLMVFDQAGGLKDMADQFALYMIDSERRQKGPFVVGVMQTPSEFNALLDSYIAFVNSRLGEGEDLWKAQTLRGNLGNKGIIRIITLDEAAPQIRANENGQWDVTELVGYFEAKAKEISSAPQKIVFVSDWRQLVVTQVSIAVSLITNLNVFITIEGKIQAETLAAIQA